VSASGRRLENLQMPLPDHTPSSTPARTAPPCPSCDAPGARWLRFDRDEGAFQCVECRCVWMPKPPPLIWYRRHANGTTAAVAARAELGHECYMAGAAPPGKPEWHSSIVGLVAAKHAADRASGCPQPCTCPPWSD
jgi:hypothetical protein